MSCTICSKFLLWPGPQSKAACCAGTRAFILLQGTNIVRPDQQLQYRLSLGSFEASGAVIFVPRDELQEWGVAYLVEPKVT